MPCSSKTGTTTALESSATPPCRTIPPLLRITTAAQSREYKAPKSDITNGVSTCGTTSDGKVCVNRSNYALYGDSQSAATGYSFYPGCDDTSTKRLNLFLAPNVFTIGTTGQAYPGDSGSAPTL